MASHNLKIWTEDYWFVKDGTKNFEIRNNDRKFEIGDKVFLSMWDPQKRRYLPCEVLMFEIGYVIPIGNNKVVFSLLPPLEVS